MLRKTILVLAIVSALAACNKGDKGPEAKKKEEASAAAAAPFLIAPEDLVAVQSSAVASGPVVTGSIQPERRADLRAELPAIVLKVLKDNGERVRRGDMLVQLDDTAIRDALMSADASARSAQQAYDQAERQVQRLKTLRASGMTSMQALDEAEVRRNNAQSEVSAAKSRAATARQQMGRTSVRAPFDGIVSDRKVSAGDTVQIGKELIKVIDPTSLRFEGFVSADKISAVKLGQNVAFTVNGYPSQVFNGTVKRIDPAANPSTRQVAVMVSFNDKNVPAVAGLFAEGSVDAVSSNSLVLPEGAIVRAGDIASVWRVRNNVMNKVAVTLGERDMRRGSWIVNSGVALGDTVIRSPGSTLKDGQKIAFTGAPKPSVPPGEAADEARKAAERK
ncbi:MAG TPA: efflux RND transporter periplasmic adaptor subunit [Burkholderiaceae bacterium]